APSLARAYLPRGVVAWLWSRRPTVRPRAPRRRRTARPSAGVGSVAKTSEIDRKDAAHELGLLHRSRLPGAARLDERVRAARDLAARDDLARARHGRAARGDGAASRAGQGARAVGHAPAPRAGRTGHGTGAPRADARDPRHVPDR